MKSAIRRLINDSINIEELLLKNNVDFKIVSGEYRILCPFHQEKTPSCFISEELRAFHCFGCQAKGDLVYLFSKIEKKSIERFIDENKNFEDIFPSSLGEYSKVKEELKKEQERKLIEYYELSYVYTRLCELYRFLSRIAMKNNPLSEYYVLLYRVENFLDYYDDLLSEKKNCLHRQKKCYNKK